MSKIILLTGTVSTLVPFEVQILAPKIFNDRESISSYVKDHFTHVLQERGVCSDKCVLTGWEMGISLVSKESQGGITYHIYAEREQGVITYHLRSESLHIIYRSDAINVNGDQVSIAGARSASEVIGPDTLYWNLTPHPAVRTALMMSLVSGYAGGKVHTGIELPKTYEEVSKIVPEDDPITTMIIVYAMLKANDKYALFHIQDGSLFLYADQGYIGLDETVKGFEDGAMCDPDRLYAFSPMYRDIPSTVDGAVEMFSGQFKSDTNVEKEFRTLLEDAFSPGLAWKEKITRIIPLLQLDTSDVETTSYALMRIVAKHKLLKGANSIFSQFPCSVPNKQSP